MDISIFGVISLVAIFLPLFFALYLLISRLKLSYVNKNILNYGCGVVNLISFLIFGGLYFLTPEKKVLYKNIEVFLIDKFNLNLGFVINESNIIFLILSSFLCLIISLYSKKYFDKKKQFIFTKQRFYTYLSFLSFFLYIFLSSINLMQSAAVLILQSILILVFSYIDIFKNSINHNSIRFHRITHCGNFFLIIALLVLFRYACFSQGYIEDCSLEYGELEKVLNYAYGNSANYEFALLALGFVGFLLCRLAIFPASCYYSFFANSSNILYLTISNLANNVVGLFLFVKILPLFEILKEYVIYFEIFLGIGILFALVQLLFEQNIKIIFGYLTSLFNSIFIILFLNFDSNIVLYLYFGYTLFFTLILEILFLKDKNNLSKRLINKQFGFALERAHIFFFEVISEKITKIFEIFDEKILQNIFPFFVKVFNFLVSLFVVRTSKISSFGIIRNILIIFSLIALFAIFIALFGGLS